MSFILFGGIVSFIFPDPNLPCFPLISLFFGMVVLTISYDIIIGLELERAVLLNLLEGLQKKWYPNKKLAAVRYYVSNKKEGLHEGWWDNGRKQYTYQFHNDEYQGEVKEWYSDGELFKVFHYEKGHEEGSERLWFQDGSVRANYVIKKGRKYGLIGIKLCKNPYEKSVN